MARVSARAAASLLYVRGTPREDGAGLAELTQHCFGRLLGTVKDCFRPKAVARTEFYGGPKRYF